MSPSTFFSRFPTAKRDAESAKLCVRSPQTCSSSYMLSYTDSDFLMRDELRPVRLQLELIKPEILQQEHGIEATVVIFGGARIPDEETAAQRLLDAEEKARQTIDAKLLGIISL